jgi:hypothetical protein
MAIWHGFDESASGIKPIYARVHAAPDMRIENTIGDSPVIYRVARCIFCIGIG